MAHTPSFTLLIIEPHASKLEWLRNRLSMASSRTDPVDVFEAAEVREALATVADVAVDVILLDLSTPRDCAAVRELCQAAPNVPIVITTDAAHESLAFEAVRAGAQDYV